MIQDWRRAWGQGDFPFYFVQLASFGTGADWPRLREAQTNALILPATGMAVAIDIGTSNDIHPKNKQEVGRRLALWALRDVHGKPVTVSGPIAGPLGIQGAEMSLSFSFSDGLKTSDGGPLKGFQVAGEDKVFVEATARIQADRVVVSAPGVANPKFVRYAWASDPKCNLVNGAGLPASPFRTDID
jgi:sialate O-acetylesterase